MTRGHQAPDVLRHVLEWIDAQAAEPLRDHLIEGQLEAFTSGKLSRSRVEALAREIDALLEEA